MNGRAHRLGVLALACFGMVGCSGSGGEEASAWNPMDVRLRDLSSPQQAEFCEWYIQDAFPDEMRAQQCEAEAVRAGLSGADATDSGTLPADCEQQRVDCIEATGADPGPDEKQCRDAVASKTCLATGREFEDSIGALVAAAAAHHATFPRCSELAPNTPLPDDSEALDTARQEYAGVLARCPMPMHPDDSR